MSDFPAFLVVALGEEFGEELVLGEDFLETEDFAFGAAGSVSATLVPPELSGVSAFS
ncbi:MAG: hypothetical protein P1U68_02035 [Verrucomicrobiales bacterium]|nr:hypothetical protein [Verrucomicrobiales bacterium]